jgi:hypothetical protein
MRRPGRAGLSRRGFLGAAPALLAVGLLLSPRPARGQASGVPRPHAPPVPPGTRSPAPAAPPASPGPAAPPAAPAPREPGVPAPPDVVADLQRTLALGIQRFQAKDLEGVLALISEDYWTGPFTKRTVRVQLQAMFQLNQAVAARVTIDAVRLVGPHAWVYSTGAIDGQLYFVGQWTPLFVWDRQLEIARREAGGWRLFGYQQ